MWLITKNKYSEIEIKRIIASLIEYRNNLFPFSDLEANIDNLIKKLCDDIDMDFPSGLLF